MNIKLHNICFKVIPWHYLLIILAGYVQPSYAQYENVWIFGKNTGVDFNKRIPTAIVSSIGTTDIYGEAGASVCDAKGALLFYTEGSLVLDQQHNLMPNGNNLTPVTSVDQFTPTSSTSQGTIIIPMPGHGTKYYIFSLTSREQQVANNLGRLYYSIVDMSLNGGLGNVVAGQKGIPLDSNLTEHMTAVAGNDCNIWLLTWSRTTHQLKAFRITTSGINATPVLSGPFPGYTYAEVGCIAISPDRTKMALTADLNNFPSLALLDFDATSGIASNMQQLSSLRSYGVCFSPDNTKLYVNQNSSGNSSIYQFDLSAGSLANIMNSRTLIANAGFSHLKLAPDNKIYFIRTTTSLSVINLPDQPGLACQPQPNAVLSLPGTTMYGGLPNAVPVMKQDTMTSKTYIEKCDSKIMLGPKDTSGWGYIWNDGIIGISRPAVNQSGTYWVSYRSPCRYHTDTFQITVFPSFHHRFTRVICGNESFDFNGKFLNSSGIYRDSVTTVNGCDSTVTLDLVVLPVPEISLSVNQNTMALCMGDSVLVEVTHTGASTYQWYSNDRFVGERNREHIYLTHFSNKIMVIGLADNGCRDTAERIINVAACCELFVPNAFSPNGDGTNDVFASVPHGNIRNYRIQLFNRWSQLVFSAFDSNKSWDGTFNGTPADAGTYYYYISAECIEGTKLVRRGDVILIK